SADLLTNPPSLEPEAPARWRRIHWRRDSEGPTRLRPGPELGRLVSKLFADSGPCSAWDTSFEAAKSLVEIMSPSCAIALLTTAAAASRTALVKSFPVGS